MDIMLGDGSNAPLVLDDGKEGGALGGGAEEVAADGVAAGVERLVEKGEGIALLGGAGLRGAGGDGQPLPRVP